MSSLPVYACHPRINCYWSLPQVTGTRRPNFFLFQLQVTCYSYMSFSTSFHLAPHFPFCFAPLDCLPLVKFLFSARDCKLHFQFSPLIIQNNRHDCIRSFKRTRFLPKRFDLMSKKLDAGVESFQKLIIEFCFSVLQKHLHILAKSRTPFHAPPFIVECHCAKWWFDKRSFLMSNGMTNLKDNVKEVKEKGKKVLKTFTSKGGKDTQGPPLQPGREFLNKAMGVLFIFLALMTLYSFIAENRTAVSDIPISEVAVDISS